jgi:exopolyphosphatase/pppGpp-phosphohydrolase
MTIARQNRRIMVTVPNVVAEELEKIRLTTGLAATGFIRQMLMQSLPALRQVADALRAARAGSGEKATEALRGLAVTAGNQLQLLNAEIEHRDEKLPLSPLKSSRKRKRRSGGTPPAARRRGPAA